MIARTVLSLYLYWVGDCNMEASTVYRIAAGGLMLLFVAVGLSMGVSGSAVAQSGELVDVDTADLDGAGTEENPYVITNTSELQAMEDDLGAYYVLADDINASDTHEANDGAGFVPIEFFRGSFNGNGYKISELHINRSEESDIGMFGIVDGGEVRNVEFTQISITGYDRVGGVIGKTEGDTQIRRVSVSGDITGNEPEYTLAGGVIGGANDNTSIRRVSTSVDVTGSETVGGIIGQAGDNTILTGVSSSGSVTGDRAGGVIGGSFQNTTIQNVSTSANVIGTGDLGRVGGLIGLSNGFGNGGVEIQNVSASGNVVGSGIEGAGEVGGLIGYIFSDTTVYDATATGDVNGTNDVGGLVGLQRKSKIAKSSASGSVVGTAAFSQAGGLVGSSFNNTIIQNSSASGSVSGSEAIGGLIGEAESTTTVRHTYATGSVNGNDSVGGLVGLNTGTVATSFATGQVSGTTNVSGFIGRNTDADGQGSVSDSYWDTDATGQAASAGSATGLSTAQMTGSAAQDSMSALDFDTVWNVQSGDYPILVHQTDDTTDESSSVQVQLSNINLTPQTVNSGSESTHRLTFETQNVSADGKEDDFDITFPDKVELVSYSDVEIDEKSSGVDMTANTLEFSVDPTGGGSTQVSGELNVTVSATN